MMANGNDSAGSEGTIGNGKSWSDRLERIARQETYLERLEGALREIRIYSSRVPNLPGDTACWLHEIDRIAGEALDARIEQGSK
jgi:hypothetical protein